MKYLNIVIMSAVVGMSSQALANENLAKSKNCFACHSVNNKLVGPAFKDVAAKYKDDKSAPDALALKIKNGGKGVWGQVPMPPNNVTDEESKQLAKWVLTLK